MDITKRDFIKGAGALFGLAPLGGCKGFFASPRGGAAAGKPELTIGIISDIHIAYSRGKDGKEAFHGDAMLRKTLEWFRDNGADGVAAAGDLADHGLLAELDKIGEIWFSVFPGGKAPDGRKVEQLFVYGNHDWDGFRYGNAAKRLYGDGYMKHAIRNDLAAAWRNAFREDWSPVWRKEVKGYTFAGAHWIADHCRGREERGVPQAPQWLADNAKTIDPSKPFFFLQHPPPKNTCHGPWLWGRDDGRITKALTRFPNAIALSGHSHASIGDERAIWQGEFTSIGCGSLKYTGLEYGDTKERCRENDAAAYSREESAGRIMRRLNTGDGHQGMLAKVYSDRIVFERRDFEDLGSLGPDWIMPLPAREKRVFSFAARAQECAAPEFTAGAKLDARFGSITAKASKGAPKTERKTLELSIPAANARPDARVFDYAVEIAGGNGATDRRYVFAEGFHRSTLSKRAAAPTAFAVALDSLKAQGALSVKVFPRNSFGKEGKPLAVSI